MFRNSLLGCAQISSHSFRRSSNILVAVIGGNADCAVEKDVLRASARLVFCGGAEIPAAVLREAAAAVSNSGCPLDRATLGSFAGLRHVASSGAGVDDIDLGAAAEMGISVSNVPDYGVEEVADSTLSLILNLYRRTHFAARALEEGQRFPSMAEMSGVVGGCRRVRGQTLGLVGLGRIGTAVARRAAVFGFRVLFYSPTTVALAFEPDGVDKALGLERAESLGALLREADCVSLHCPIRPETRHLIDARALGLLKGSYLVNTARGGLVDEVALAAALASGRLGAAALDVHEAEPFDPGQGPLAGAPNLISTPHVAFYSHEAFDEMRRKAAMEVKRGLDSGWDVKSYRNCLNAPMMKMS